MRFCCKFGPMVELCEMCLCCNIGSLYVGHTWRKAKPYFWWFGPYLSIINFSRLLPSSASNPILYHANPNPPLWAFWALDCVISVLEGGRRKSIHLRSSRSSRSRSIFPSNSLLRFKLMNLMILSLDLPSFISFVLLAPSSGPFEYELL